MNQSPRNHSPKRHFSQLQLAVLATLAWVCAACAQPALGGGGFAPAVCGNAICEAGEPEACPSDCKQNCPAACTAAACTGAGEIQDCITNQAGCKVLAVAKACPGGQKCSAGQCLAVASCGDGVCVGAEKATCPLDCPGGCSNPCIASVCGPGGGISECSAGPDGCSVLGAEKPCPAGSECSGDACISTSKDHVKIESVKFTGEKSGFPTYLAPMFGKTIGGSKFAVVSDLVLTNPTDLERTVTVKAWLQGFSEEGGTPAPVVLGPGETKTIPHIDIPFTCGKLDPVVTETQAAYKLAIYENGIEVDARKANVAMLPKGTVLWLPPGFEPTTIEEQQAAWTTMAGMMVSMYTTKNDSWGEVDKLVAEASKLAKTGLTGFSLESKSEQEQEKLATEALIAIFKALKARGVNYSSVSTDYFKAGQNIRYPAESLTVGSQNCIDGAVVFASALERMDYRPVVVFIPGHAFVGARATKSGPLVFIETTMVGGKSAEKAVEYARGEVDENFIESSPYQFSALPSQNWTAMMDVRALHEDAGLPSSFFPCGPKPAPQADPCGSNPQCKCQKSLDCKRNGKCTVVNTGTGCGVVTSADCTKSTDCIDWGKCAAVLQNGEMVCAKQGTGPACGDGKCDGGETAATCAKDCPSGGPTCGNGKCETGESAASCSKDCATSGPICGDLFCSAGEANTCPMDCMSKFTNAYKCLSSACAGWSACAADDFCSGILNCIAYCNCDTACQEACFADFNQNGPAVNFFTCAANANNCTDPCPAAAAVCGDGTCQSSESCQSCAKDCGACGPKCGNGACEAGETAVNCKLDCGTVGSCANACGTQVGACYCDASCVQNNDCCPDYAVLCATSSHPCDKACGGQAPSGCYCDAGCKASGDCCSFSGQANQFSCSGSTCGMCQ